MHDIKQELSSMCRKPFLKNISFFFSHRVLQMSSGIEDFGKINWELFGFLVLAWIIVYFCIWKSVKTTGKVVMFTATFPYVLLIAFVIRGCTLDGAMDGINFFIQPQWDKMMESKVWIYAAAQVFNSVGIAFGCLVAFASYNPFHGPILRDTLVSLKKKTLQKQCFLMIFFS